MGELVRLSCFSGGLCTPGPTGQPVWSCKGRGGGGGEWEGLRNNLFISQAAGWSWSSSSRCSANRLES